MTLDKAFANYRKDHSQESIKTLYHQMQVYAWAIASDSSASDLENIIQESCLRAWKKIDTFQPSSSKSFRQYFRKIVKNTVIEQYNKANPKRVDIRIDNPTDGPTVRDVDDLDLPETDRNLLLLLMRHEEYDIAAAVAGMTSNAFRKRMQKIMQRMAQKDEISTVGI